jgi:predicted AAA+ superfamily ATPase
VEITRESTLLALEAWKKASGRKPLVLRGARQVGKTHVIKKFAKQSFVQNHYFNFEEEPELKKFFLEDLVPQRILRDLAVFRKKKIDLENDLIIFDEIQYSPEALNSLKYFNEEFPNAYIISAGSLLGLKLSEKSFPVGKVNLMSVTPLSFAEFLQALGEHDLLACLDSPTSLAEPIHKQLLDLVWTYQVVGGMPEIVANFCSERENLLSAFEAARERQKTLIQTYLADIAKHSGKVNSMHIERVLHSIPAQLAQATDGTSSRFKFKDVVAGNSGYASLVGAIDWLIATNLVHKVAIADGAEIPLIKHTKENRFKLYVLDVGILGALGSIPPNLIYQAKFGSYKGYLIENFALQEFIHYGYERLFSWQQNTSELEFVFATNQGVIPVEVKAGINLQAKSLKVFCERYNPSYSIIMSAMRDSRDTSKQRLLPLYRIKQAVELLRKITIS